MIYLWSSLCAIGMAGLVWFIVRFHALSRELVRARQQRQDVIDFQTHFSRSLAAVDEIDSAMQLMARYLADVIGAESLAVFTVEKHPDTGEPRLRGEAVAGLFPAFHPTVDIVFTKAKYRLEHLRHEYFEFGDTVIGRVAEANRGVLIESAAEVSGHALPREVETLLAVPMHVGARLVGVVCAVNRKGKGPAFGPHDLEMLENLSSQAALGCNLVTIYGERSEQERILQELEFGREIQQSLLPDSVPTWGDFRFASYSRPALEVGGDYYDFVEIDDDRLLVVVADAAGKGVPACMLMAMCRSFARSSAEQFNGLQQFLVDLNRRLFRDTDPAHFLTMGAVVVDRATGICEYGNAGHTVLLLRLPDGRLRRIRPHGSALGMLPPELADDFDTLSFRVRPGTSALLYTDGVVEATNEEDEEFGIDRLATLWAGASGGPEDMAELVLNKVKEFAGEDPHADDLTLTVISR